MHFQRRLTACLAGIAAAATCLAPLAGQRGKQAETEAQLKAVQAEIARARAQASHEQAQTDRLTRELRQAELSMGAARQTLETLRAERAQQAAQRAALAAQRAQRQSRIDGERAALAGEARAAYLAGPGEPLKLLLNQRDPARAGRMLAYYGYLARARANDIERTASDVRELDALDARLASEDQRLAALEAEQHGELDQLEKARTARRIALNGLQAESRTSEARIVRLEQEQAGLETLLRELRRAMENAPPAQGAFARLRGRLAWPVAGRIAARFGETRAGALKWDGDLIDTQRGADVRAISDGRVVFADWLPGLGLLMIIDHGDGYLSLYGHNERLYKSAGTQVAAGEPIASAGDSGGSPRPQLYFEIRKAGRPIDPRPWFEVAAPGDVTPGAAAVSGVPSRSGAPPESRAKSANWLKDSATDTWDGPRD